MEETGARWWRDRAQYAWRFNNLLLDPPGEAGTMMLDAAARDRGFADRHLFGTFPARQELFPQIEDPAAARRLIAEQAV
ncbi:MAG: hypothetical protein P8Y48_16515 [Novosphingobium sp.]